MSRKDLKQNTDESLETLMFIDTNIFLDFYRFRNSDVSIKLLDEILKRKNSIIMTCQVEMEFKKKRQTVLNESYLEFKKNNNINLNIPEILSGDEEITDLLKAKEEFQSHHKSLQIKFEKIFKDPINHDKVFIKLNKLFSNKLYNLNQESLDDIIDLAQKRFALGYPPRKNKDNSIGDAINWEWILQCASTYKKTIIIITRDSDYGYNFNGSPYLNDWLLYEFNKKTGNNQKIILTNKLTEALKIINIEVTDEMVEEEQNLINNNNYLDSLATVSMQNNISNMRDVVDRRNWNYLLDDRINRNILEPSRFDELTQMKDKLNKISQIVRNK